MRLKIPAFLFLLAMVMACSPKPQPGPQKEPQPEASGEKPQQPEDGKPKKPERTYTAEIKAIVGGTVINTSGKGPDTLANATVLIRGSRIVRVGSADEVDIPQGADVIDAAGKYVIPGLVDGHIHFFQSGGLYTRPDGLDLRHRVPYDEQLQWIRDNIDDLLRRYIRCGITTVIDMGGPMWNFEIRDHAREADIAPRVFTPGPLIASYQPDQLATDDLPIVRVTTKKQALDLVRKQVEKKTDLIKIWYVVSKKTSLGLEAFYPIVEAVVEESHAAGVPVFIHATELETARKAVEAGADVLVHSIKGEEVDEAFLDLAKEKGVIYIPTLWVFSSYASVYSKQLRLMKEEYLLGNPKIIGSLFDMYELSDDELGERQKKLLAEKKPIEPDPLMLKNLKRIHDHGITVAAGTDAGNVGVIHGPALFHDFALMAQAGLSSRDILVSATLGGAKLLGREKEAGSIEEGKLADIVLLNADPLAEIRSTSDIYLVIKDGNVFDPDRVLEKTPEDLAQIQLNAYNGRDIEAFLSVYSRDVEVYEFPSTLKYKGKDKMRETYTSLFDKAPDLHCRLAGRITIGNFVIDREYVVTGIPGKETMEAAAIYEIEDGLIQKVWFMR